jgi:hypothetical protein
MYSGTFTLLGLSRQWQTRTQVVRLGTGYFFWRIGILSPSIQSGEENTMSAQSENMMDLLKELAVLKELDGRSEAELHSEESSARRTRRQQITDQIRALGETAS